MSRPFAILALWILAQSQGALGQSRFIRLAVPVTWQLTHTHLIGPATPSLTESFRETWRLEVAPSGNLSLSSPRAKVIAYGLGAREPHELVPHRLAVSEFDFARLVGVQPLPLYESEEAEAVMAVGKPIFLYLGKVPHGGLDMNLSWTDDESYSVHFEVGADGIY